VSVAPASALWIVDRFPPDRGGLAASAFRQVHALGTSLTRVDVVRLAPDLPPGVATAETSGAVRVVRVGRARAPDESLQLLERTALNLLERHDHALVHGFGAVPAGYVATLVAGLARRPAVVSLRGNDIERAAYDGARLPMLTWALAHADAVIGVTRELLDRARVLSGRAAGLHFVPNGVDGDVFRSDAAPAADLARLAGAPRPWLATSGEARLKKGLPVLRRLAERLAQERRGTLFLLGGVRAEEREEFRRWQRESGAPVREIPYTRDDKRLAALCAAMDALVFPSLWDGMPNALLEAMACARPVVATAVGGARDVVEHGVSGVLVPPFALDRFADEALAVTDGRYGDPARLGAAARARVLRDFTVAAERDRLLVVYGTLAG
jgi:glycosyltransferase involved in cell wall biosynthesis